MQLIPIGSNQTELHTERATILFSYSTPVAAYVDGKYIRTGQSYSKTTSKHINRWLAGAQAKTVPQTELDALVA